MSGVYPRGTVIVVIVIIIIVVIMAVINDIAIQTDHHEPQYNHKETAFPQEDKADPIQAAVCPSPGTPEVLQHRR